jgi:hypothetical protein
MPDLKGMGYLKNKLAAKKSRVNLRYSYYEQKHSTFDFGISTPPDLRNWMSTLGWCGKAVDSLADRLQFYEFDKDSFDLNTIFAMNNRDTFFDSAILSALISSCCFIYIYDNDGFPALQVIDGSRATGIIDPMTGLLKEGYAVLAEDENENPTLEAYFEPGKTSYYPKRGISYAIDNVAEYPLLVPIIYRPDAKREFGHSRISRTCMSLMGSAMRTVKRSEIAAEFYSYPQKYVTGLSQEAETMDKWKATMSALMTFTKDADGDKPVLGQFSQQSMSPHADQLKMFASLFAGETCLTLDDLGFVTENPSSSEAIKASHENLRLLARKAQRTFGSGFLNVGFLSACVRDGEPYKRDVFYLERPVWEPIFEPDASALSVIGDGVIKLNQAVPGYVDTNRLREMTGIE